MRFIEMDDIDEVVEMFKKYFSSNEKETDTLVKGKIYNYQPTAVEFVMEKPEQYIIPECIDCCKLLWSKGIDTRQCGNYDDAIENGFWVEIEYDSLADKNKELLREMSNNDDRVSFCEGLQRTHNYVIRVKREDNPNASKELCDIANHLLLQDTIHYVTNENLLNHYKKIGGEWKLQKDGVAYCEINPERQNATLADALMTIEHPELYIPEEGRLYDNQHALNVHMNYLNRKDQEESKHL